jgi:outer membrane protein OmpA-like peptidoglycan-associated protein
MEKVYFDLDQATIKAESHAILDEVAILLGKFEYVTRVEIQGHTDSRAEDDYNMDLSQRRAEAVRAYLMSKGVAPQRLVAKGYGESQTVASGDTETAHAQNRRVQFIVLEMSE